MKRWTLIAVAGLALTGLLAACSSSGGLAAAARLRFLHFSPDTGNVLIRRDNVAITPLSDTADGVLVKNTASPEVAVNPETARYTGDLLDTTTLFDAELEFDPERVFIALLGKRAPADGEPAFALRTYPYDDTMTGTTAGARFLHAAVGAGAVTLVRIRLGDDLVLAEGLAFGEVSGVANGISSLVETVTTTSSNVIEARDAGGVVLATTTKSFAPGEAVNFVLLDGSGGLELRTF